MEPSSLPACPPSPPTSPPPSPRAGRAERDAAYVAALKGKARTVLKAIVVVAGTSDDWSSALILDGFEKACSDSLGARCAVGGVDVVPNRRVVVVSFAVYQVGVAARCGTDSCAAGGVFRAGFAAELACLSRRFLARVARPGGV